MRKSYSKLGGPDEYLVWAVQIQRKGQSTALFTAIEKNFFHEVLFLIDR